MMQVRIKKEIELKKLCETCAPWVVPGSVWFLKGDLGAGKTTFVKYMCEVLGVEAHVSSPTFTLINKYPGDLNIIHVDLYRIKTEEGFFALDFEAFCHSKAILFIEWPEIIPDNYFDHHVTIRCEYDGEDRIIEIDGIDHNSTLENI